MISADELGDVLPPSSTITGSHVEDLLRHKADHAGTAVLLRVRPPVDRELDAVEGDATLFKRAFEFFDKDGNGDISLSEFSGVLTDLGEPLTKEECDLFFKLVDKNNDGRLNYNEFLGFIKGGGSWGGRGESAREEDAEAVRVTASKSETRSERRVARDSAKLSSASFVVVTRCMNTSRNLARVRTECRARVVLSGSRSLPASFAGVGDATHHTSSAVRPRRKMQHLAPFVERPYCRTFSPPYGCADLYLL